MDNQDHYSIFGTFFDENPVIDFDMIASDVGDIPDFDIIKLLENNNVSVDVAASPCTGVVQPASPDIAFINVQEQLLSPNMFLMQPVSSGTTMESELSSYSSQILSSDPVYFQPANPDLHYVVSCPSHHSSTESVVLPSVEPFLSQITEEAASVQIKQQQATQINQDNVQINQENAQMRQEITQIKQELAPRVPNISSTSVASVQSFGDAANAPKKRGLKRKYPKKIAKKIKMYQMAPAMDEETEKKRKNAITAKEYRDKQKYKLESLLKHVKLLTAENNSLKKQLEEEKQSKEQ